MGDNSTIDKDLAQLTRLALEGKLDDVRLMAARLVRAYRASNPELSGVLEGLLKANPSRSATPLRKDAGPVDGLANPDDRIGPLGLFKRYEVNHEAKKPILKPTALTQIEQLITERQNAGRLMEHGLLPTKSAIFIGPPGVGKTLAAHWIAHELKQPLLVLDLSSVMSSYLGRTGANIRAAIDFAKATESVLLLDEIDAIAKRRGDDADVGELKRLVAVILQEIDLWPASGLLLAATNHAELIDPALWRRFDITLNFDLPNSEMVRQALKRFLGADESEFGIWINVLQIIFEQTSFSDIERTINRFRRALALKLATVEELIVDFVGYRAHQLSQESRINLAVTLSEQSVLTQRSISEATGVSRDTIRKYRKGNLIAS